MLFTLRGRARARRELDRLRWSSSQAVDLARAGSLIAASQPSAPPSCVTIVGGEVVGADLLLFRGRRVRLEVGDRLRDFVLFALEAGRRDRACRTPPSATRAERRRRAARGRRATAARRAHTGAQRLCRALALLVVAPVAEAGGDRGRRWRRRCGRAGRRPSPRARSWSCAAARFDRGDDLAGLVAHGRRDRVQLRRELLVVDREARCRASRSSSSRSAFLLVIVLGPRLVSFI